MKYNETACAGDGGTSSVLSNAPEETLDVITNVTEKTLKENQTFNELLEENINSRARLKKRMKALHEAAQRLNEKEELDEDDVEFLDDCRYEIQKWDNASGEEWVDVDGTIKHQAKDGPSEYEKWREKLNDKRKKARIEQGKLDWKNNHRSTAVNEDAKFEDGQEDEFLKWYKRNYEHLDRYLGRKRNKYGD